MYIYIICFFGRAFEPFRFSCTLHILNIDTSIDQCAAMQHKVLEAELSPVTLSFGEWVSGSSLGTKLLAPVWQLNA